MNWHQCSLKDIAEHSKTRDIVMEYKYGTSKNSAPGEEVIEFNDGTMAACSMGGFGGSDVTPPDYEIKFWIYR